MNKEGQGGAAGELGLMLAVARGRSEAEGELLRSSWGAAAGTGAAEAGVHRCAQCAQWTIMLVEFWTSVRVSARVGVLLR